MALTNRARIALPAAAALLAPTLLALPALTGTAAAVSPTIVISQVYGGGGNAGAPLTHDYVELFNRGTTAASLAGWSIQYASATGTGNLGANSGQLTELPAISLAPGQYLLVQEASNAAVGAPLPAPDVIDASPIAMAAGAGKVALANIATGLGCNGGSTPCSPARLANIVDLIGYGNANFFEGAAAPTLSNTTAALRKDDGCTETDNNASDFSVLAPAPRNTAAPLDPCGADDAPAVSSTTPAGGATNVATSANVTVTFTEPVDVTGSWVTIECTTTGAHPAATTGGPTTFTLDPASDFSPGETCTVTIVAAQVADQDVEDPPNEMAANHTFSFTTEVPVPIVAIHDIQGASHTSPLVGTAIRTTGIVTARASNGFYVQDNAEDSDDATSEAIFVFTGTGPAVAAGDEISVRGTVTEFRPGGASSTNLTTTELTGPSVTLLSSGQALPAATVVGTGGRIPPSTVIDDDSFGLFDPASDGIDFYESLEGMRLQVNNAVAVGPRNNFGEIAVVGDDGANASVRTTRGGIVIRADDFNPERIFIDDVLATTPTADVGDHFTAPLTGVLDYSFGNYKLLVTAPPTVESGGLTREVTGDAGERELAVATFNVENLDPGDPQAKFDELAQLVVNNLRSPDLIGIEEIQDNNGPINDATVDADQTAARLIDAIAAAGGPAYDFRNINPVDDRDGGEPGGNIRVAFLFRADRGLAFVDRPGGTPTSSTTVNPGPELSASPGRIDPTNPAFNSSRKPLAGEFTYRGRSLFVVVNHFNSKGGDQPLFGRFQPPTRSSEAQRHQQAQIVNDFVDQILAEDAGARVVVLGDINDFEFSETVNLLKGGVLHDLVETLPQSERYGYVFEGNSQTLDHILVSDGLFNEPLEYDVVHVNSEFAAQASDHDPSVARFSFANVAPTVTSVTSTPTSCAAASSVTVNFTDPDFDDTFSATVDWGDGTSDQLASVTSPFTATHNYAHAGSYTVTVVVSDDDGGVSAPKTGTAVVTYTAAFGAPLDSDDPPPVFKHGRTIPVKLTLVDCDGSTPADLAPTLTVVRISPNTPDGEDEAASTSGADTGNTMRWADGHYVYNLGTRQLSDPTATYRLTVTVPATGQTISTDFGLRR
jgi:predicted extracellular nuclease